MRQFFAPPLPDPRAGWYNNTTPANESGGKMNVDEDPNDDVSIESIEDIGDRIQ